MTSLNLLDLLDLFRRHWLRVLAFGLVFAAAAIGLASILPPSYRATAVILPPDEDEFSSMGSATRRNLGALSGLGRLGGKYFTQADIALAILRSRTLAVEVVDAFSLRGVYGASNDEFAVRSLRDHTKIRLATDGTISVSVEDRKPDRAAAIANHYLAGLDRYNRQFRSFRARRTRVFLERRVAEADSALRHSEIALAAYQNRRGSFVLSPEARGAVEVASSLMAQKAMAEVELQLARQYTAERSDEIRRLEARVNELRRQIGEVPRTVVGAASLMREVTTQQQILALLTAQLEDARIQEAMDTPTIQVLDRAEPPEVKSWPRRSIFAVFGFALGVLTGLVLSPGTGILLGRRLSPER